MFCEECHERSSIFRSRWTVLRLIMYVHTNLTIKVMWIPRNSQYQSQNKFLNVQYSKVATIYVEIYNKNMDLKVSENSKKLKSAILFIIINLTYLNVFDEKSEFTMRGSNKLSHILWPRYHRSTMREISILISIILVFYSTIFLFLRS